VSRSHTVRHTHLVGPLRVISWLQRRHYLLNTKERQRVIPSLGFEPTIPAVEQLQTYALGGGANSWGRAVNCTSMKEGKR